MATFLMRRNQGVLRFDPKSNKTTTVIPDDAFHLSADADEKLLAVSRWFPTGGRNTQEEFGIRLYKLPSMKLTTTFAIEKHQLVTGTLSPDGRLLACEASDLKSHGPHSIIVFDTATGEQVARRKGFGFVEIVFSPKGDMLFLPHKGYMEGEPVAVWKLPER